MLDCFQIPTTICQILMVKSLFPVFQWRLNCGVKWLTGKIHSGNVCDQSVFDNINFARSSLLPLPTRHFTKEVEILTRHLFRTLLS